MLNAIRHRGPDDQGIYSSDATVLGHRRLSIIDLSGGHQPISSPSQNTWMVFNGEIYNYREKRAELERRGRQFLTSSDSEVIVQLYDEFGQDCVQHLRGMFAFSIWDKRNRSLFAARDHLGQKPFFYARAGEDFLFASEIKALLAADSSLAEPDRESLDQYLNLRIIASPRTMFRRIRKLPPGHCLSFSERDGLNVQRYWDLDYQPKLEGSDDDLVDQLEQEIIDSLRHHIVSDVPVGAFLSGGLDSTLVVSMLMKHVTQEPIQTFSIGLPYQQFDEAPYAKMVAEKYGTHHHEQIIRPSLVKALPKLVWHLDEPSDPLSVCSYLIAEMARKHVKVAIGGDGGDELFGGYDRYYGNHYADVYARIPASVRKHIVGPLLDLVPDGRWYKSKAHQVKWLHRLASLNGGARYAASLGYFYFSRVQRRDLYGSEMSDGFEDMDPEAPIRVAFERARATDMVDRMLYSDSQVRLPDHPVMILDRMTMAHSLEARSPLMDHRLAEFAARLPVRMKVRGRSLRYIQVRLAERYLPESVLKRPKQGFSSALPYMLKEEYKHLYRVLLSSSRLADDGFFRQDAIDRLVNEHSRQKTDHGNRLWLLINSEVWYRMHIKGCSIAELDDVINATLPAADNASDRESGSTRL
jgi:asparagine synthase (glutamine-hydrolysing)